MIFKFAKRNAPSKALNGLKRSDRLEGTALISNGVLLHEDCPRGTDIRLFSQSVVRLFDGLENKGEYANDIFMKFDGGNLLLMFHHPLILCLFANRDCDLSSVENGGKQFLSNFGATLGASVTRPKIKPEKKKTKKSTSTALILHSDAADFAAWEKYRTEIVALFAKVLGSAQASKIINRELTAMGLNKGGFIKISQFRSFGEKLCQRIRDKRIKRQIENELFTIIDKFG